MLSIFVQAQKWYSRDRGEQIDQTGLLKVSKNNITVGKKVEVSWGIFRCLDQLTVTREKRVTYSKVWSGKVYQKASCIVQGLQQTFWRSWDGEEKDSTRLRDFWMQQKTSNPSNAVPREREENGPKKMELYTIEKYYQDRIPPRFFLLSKNLGQKSRLPSHYFYYYCEDVCKLYCCNLAACSRICYARYSSLDSQWISSGE